MQKLHLQAHSNGEGEWKERRNRRRERASMLGVAQQKENVEKTMIKLKEIVCHTKKSEQFMTDVSRSCSETPEYLHRFESKSDGRLKACACVCVLNSGLSSDPSVLPHTEGEGEGREREKGVRSD